MDVGSSLKHVVASTMTLQHQSGSDLPPTSQKAKLDLQKSIVTNSSTYLINCNFFLTVVQFISVLFKLFLKLVPFDFYKQNLVVISKI
jgi:hypothetical protein